MLVTGLYVEVLVESDGLLARQDLLHQVEHLFRNNRLMQALNTHDPVSIVKVHRWRTDPAVVDPIAQHLVERSRL